MYDQTIHFDMNLFKFYQKLINIRKNNEALMIGDYKTLYAKGEIFCFERNSDNNRIIVLINN